MWIFYKVTPKESDCKNDQKLLKCGNTKVKLSIRP